MKNIIITTLIIIVTISGYFLGYPVFQLKHTESILRDRLQNINVDYIINEDKSNNDIADKLLILLKNNLINIDTKNQYPIFQINITANNNIQILNGVTEITLKNIINMQKDYLCQRMIGSFKDEPNITKQALINILEQDGVIFEITVINENGSKITQYNQKAIDCLGLWATNSI